ncbi:MAG: DUF4445 domain-containing protein [Clostridia bacterium]|nr:DUF4445 domain-containing protein [Clostridia bacterium]
MNSRKNCIFGGNCHECGRCEQFGLDARKDHLTFLPTLFLASLEKDKQTGFGVAFDIGTTTVVGLLWDLSENKLMHVLSAANPQSAYGQDVISRIHYCMEEEDGLNKLNSLLMDCLNDLIKKMADELSGEDIRKVVAVGNTTMCHILLNKDPSSLAKAPFHPVYTGAVHRRASALGFFVSPEVELLVVSGIAGHVGSDITAGILATNLQNADETILYIDVGTNGEIVLASGNNLFTCSTAAGPAFEGASIRFGMRAAVGAIEKVQITCNDVICKTISNETPCGICGSGLIDAVAQMLEWGIVNYKGRMIRPGENADLPLFLQTRLSLSENGPEFFLTKEISICQQDIREVQLAKGAVLAGATLLLEAAEKGPEDLDAILIAGAFGSYINKVNALKIGLLPPVEQEIVSNVGNAAGAGACMVLLSEISANEAETLPRRIKHVNLAEHPHFEHCYAHAMYFPK